MSAASLGLLCFLFGQSQSLADAPSGPAEGFRPPTPATQVADAFPAHSLAAIGDGGTPATRVLQATLQMPDERGLPGQPLSLKRLLATAATRDARKAAVLSYWRLSHAVAEYSCAVDELRRLDKLAAPGKGYDQLRWAALRSAAEVRATSRRLHAIRAQRELAPLIAEPAAGLPLPSDKPCVGAYETHFAVLHEHGAAPLQLSLIDQTLPIQQQLIAQLADSVLDAERLLDEAAGLYQRQQLPLAEVVAAFSALRDQRRGFLAAVAGYNADIAEYALTLNLPGADDERLVGMLIETVPGTVQSVLADRSGTAGGIQRVSNEQPLGGDDFEEPPAATSAAEGFSSPAAARLLVPEPQIPADGFRLADDLAPPEGPSPAGTSELSDEASSPARPRYSLPPAP